MKNANIEIHLQDLDFPIQLSKKEKIEKLKERILVLRMMLDTELAELKEIEND
jgi:hypothetical protein